MNTTEENEDGYEEKDKKESRKNPTTRTDYYRKLENKIDCEEKKIDNITNNIQDELKKIELEWLHLKGMMNNSKISEEQKLEKIESQEQEIGLDDAIQINEMQCDFELNLTKEIKTNFSESESDFSDDNLLEEEDCDDNIFI